MSRSFGDYDVKPPLSAVPEIREVMLNRHARSIIVMASDGLWDVLTNQEASMIVWNLLHKGHDAKQAADMLIRDALTQGAVDNITALVVDLQPMFTTRKRTLRRPPPQAKSAAAPGNSSSAANSDSAAPDPSV